MKNFLIEIALLLLESIRLTRRQRKIEKKIGRTKADRERERAKERGEVELLISHFHFLLRFAFTSNDF